jgi:multiple sugar transport system substrate-binding protein
MKKCIIMLLAFVFAFGVVAQAKTELEVWYHEYGEEGTYDAVLRYAEMFEEAHPDIDVKVNWIPGDYDTKLQTALLSKRAKPDVFEVNGIDPNMVKQGLLVPLDDLFTEEIKNDFTKQSLDFATIDGHIYAAKMVIDAGVIYYNKKLLNEEGLDIPKTYEELANIVDKLTTNRVKGIFIGNDGGGNFTENLIYAAGVPGPITEDGTKVTFGIPEYRDKTIKALEAVRKLNKSGNLLIGAPADWWSPDALTYGLAAAQWGGFWSFPQVKEMMGDNFVVTPIPPLGEDGEPATFFGGWMCCVNNNSKNIEAATEYVKWMWIEKNKEIQVDWNTGYGFHIPPRKYAAAASPELTEDSRAAKLVKYTQEYGEVGRYIPLFNSKMKTALNDMISEAIKTNNPISEIVDKYSAKMQKALDDYLNN